MKKPVKIAIWSIVALVVLVIAAVLALPLWIGPVATSVANAVAPGFTGTDFKLDSFALNPYSGKIRVGALKLSNPKGYDEPAAFSLKSLSVDLDFGSLLSDTIHVRDITIEDPFVSYVFDDAGSNNFERILANVNAKLGPSEEKAEEKKEEKPGKKVMIDRLCINGTKVKYRMITLPIPLPTLTNIGKKSGGATPTEVRDTVWEKMKDSFTGVGAGIGSAVNALGGGATKALRGAASFVDDAGKAGGAVAKEAAAKATETVTKVGDVAKDATSKATEAVTKVADVAKVTESTAKAGDAAKDLASKASSAATDGAKALTGGAGKAAEKAAEGLKKLNPFAK